MDEEKDGEKGVKEVVKGDVAEDDDDVLYEPNKAKAKAMIEAHLEKQKAEIEAKRAKRLGFVNLRVREATQRQKYTLLRRSKKTSFFNDDLAVVDEPSLLALSETERAINDTKDPDSYTDDEYIKNHIDAISLAIQGAVEDSNDTGGGAKCTNRRLYCSNRPRFAKEDKRNGDENEKCGRSSWFYTCLPFKYRQTTAMELAVNMALKRGINGYIARALNHLLVDPIATLEALLGKPKAALVLRADPAERNNKLNEAMKKILEGLTTVPRRRVMRHLLNFLRIMCARMLVAVIGDVATLNPFRLLASIFAYIGAMIGDHRKATAISAAVLGALGMLLHSLNAFTWLGAIGTSILGMITTFGGLVMTSLTSTMLVYGLLACLALRMMFLAGKFLTRGGFSKADTITALKEKSTWASLLIPSGLSVENVRMARKVEGLQLSALAI